MNHDSWNFDDFINYITYVDPTTFALKGSRKPAIFQQIIANI